MKMLSDPPEGARRASNGSSVRESMCMASSRVVHPSAAALRS